MVRPAPRREFSAKRCVSERRGAGRTTPTDTLLWKYYSNRSNSTMASESAPTDATATRAPESSSIRFR